MFDVVSSENIRPGFCVISPTSDKFPLPEARQWALDNHYLYVEGLPQCVHALYLMDQCPDNRCRQNGLDHTQLWACDTRGTEYSRPFILTQRRPFILTQPYLEEISQEISEYGQMHGLRVSSYARDGWYGHGSLPIRLEIINYWGLWPVERELIAMIQTMSFEWPNHGQV